MMITTMITKILILNGPNLNMLGQREPEIYGSQTLQDINDLCHAKANDLDIEIECFQSNHEGELVERIQKSIGRFDAILINGAAYTHTSVAIHDALKLTGLPVAEVHLSEPKERESFRHLSYIEPVASVHVSGKGAQGYIEALQGLYGILLK